MRQFFVLVKPQAGNGIINNLVFSNEHNNAAVEVASSSIFERLKNAATIGNICDIMDMCSSDLLPSIL